MALTRTRRRRVLALLGVLALVAPATVATASTVEPVPAVPIPQDPAASSVKPFLGTPASARPIRGARFAPRHPFMAANDRSNLHNDAYQSDAGRAPGPRGIRPSVTSTLYTQERASVTFDSRGRIVTVCVGLATVDLRVLDPRTLDVLADNPLPPRPASSLANPFTAFGGGGYFYLDHKDRAVVPTSDGHIDVVAVRGAGDTPRLTLHRRYDVSSHVGDSVVLSALPDWAGRLWFVTSSGVVGAVDRRTGTSRAMELRRDETIGNSVAVDEAGGVFVVSDHALYRFQADRRGRPEVSWRKPYDAGTRTKPGQSQYGSGTTPTIIRRGSRRYVAITDNADPRMHALVYRADREGPGGRSAPCRSSGATGARRTTPSSPSATP